MNPILVAGTWGWKDNGTVEWYCPGHPFGQFLAAQGHAPVYDGNKPFEWSTGLNGTFWTGRRDWQAGGAALAYFCRSLGRAHVDIIGHSHFLQVVAFAAAEHDLKIDTLISVSSPIRKDMAAEYAALRKNTRYWLHLHSDGSDKMQWLGELFDGGWRSWIPGGDARIVRSAPLADRNDFVPGVGHSDLLYRPEQYHHWVDRGWLAALGAPAGV